MQDGNLRVQVLEAAFSDTPDTFTELHLLQHKLAEM